jgi:membrane-bound ClpP family serine protease
MSNPNVAPSKWLTELDDPVVAYLMLVVGLIGLAAELTSRMFPGRIALFGIAFVAGALGVVRRRRRFAVASLRERGRPA